MKKKFFFKKNSIKRATSSTVHTAALLRASTTHGTGSLGHRINGSFGSSFTSGSPDHHSDPAWDPSFSGFRKKCPKCKTYIWNAEMTKVIVRCLLLDWNHWMSVHAMNFYFCLWLLKIPWPEKTSSWLQWRHCSIFTHKSTFWVHYRTGSPGQLGLRVAGFPGHWVRKCDPVPSLAST